jgi:hypothetical protein
MEPKEDFLLYSDEDEEEDVSSESANSSPIHQVDDSQDDGRIMAYLEKVETAR